MIRVQNGAWLKHVHRYFVLGLLVGCAGRPVRAQELRRAAAEDPTRTVAHAAGQVIVKFHPEAAAAVEHANQQGSFPTVGVESMETLFAQFGIRTCESLFPMLPDQTQDAVGLNRLYLCTLGPGADVEAAVQAFGQDPNVEYAEPNYIATLHSEIDTPAVGE